MPYQYSDYPTRAQRLAGAGQSLLDTLQNPDLDRSLAVGDLEAATLTGAEADSRQRFTAANASADPNASSQKTPDDALSALLIELQSANLLMSAGIALNEGGEGPDPQYLEKSVNQIASTRSTVDSALARTTQMHFAPQEKPSASLEDAVRLFHDSGDKALDSIADGTASIINSLIEKLKALDGAKILQAIDSLGKSTEIVATAGRLIRQGLDKLKAVLDALSDLFGDKAIEDAKAKVKEIWEKIEKGEYTEHAVRWILGTDDAEHRVEAICSLPDLKAPTLDGISRELAGLEDRFQNHLKILKGLLAAVTIAAGILAILHTLGPWLAAATAGAYLSILAAALIIGMNSTGSRKLAGWGEGVCVVIEMASSEKDPV